MTDVKTIIITGGTSGLGRQLVHRLSSKGHSVVFCGRRANLVEEVMSVEKARGAMVHGESGDVRDPSFARHLMRQTRNIFGEPDCLVNNAATFGRVGQVLSTLPSDLSQTLSDNIISTINCCREFLEVSTSSRYRTIVNIGGGGIGGRSVEEAAFPYVVSKAALYYFTEILASSIGNTNVTVNTLAPGAMPTEFMETARQDAIETNDKHLLGEIDKRASIDGEAIFNRVVLWIESLVKPEFSTVSGRLLSVQWDEPTKVLRAAASPDMYRLKRVDGVLFDRLSD